MSLHPWREYLRPWKLFTLAAGFSLLVIGALMAIATDWDIPVSALMALLAYLTAPWSLRVLPGPVHTQCVPAPAGCEAPG